MPKGHRVSNLYTRLFTLSRLGRHWSQSTIIVDHRRSIDIDRQPRLRRPLSTTLSLLQLTSWQTRNIIPLLSILCPQRTLSPCLMFSRRDQLYCRVKSKGVVTMMFCQRCVLRQLKCRLSFLFKKCAKCIRTKKKCESITSMMNFDAIDRALAKLEEEEMKVKAIQLIATKQLRASFVKLQRLKKQKRFLREKEQKMFDKKFFDVKKMKRLKGLEQAIILKRIISIVICFDDFTTLSSIDLN